MNTRKLLSGAAALALLCSAGSCGQNESEQTHAEVCSRTPVHLISPQRMRLSAQSLPGQRVHHLLTQRLFPQRPFPVPNPNSA